MINVTFYEGENYVDIETAECQWTIEKTRKYDIDRNGIITIIDDEGVIRAKFPFSECVIVFED